MVACPLGRISLFPSVVSLYGVRGNLQVGAVSVVLSNTGAGVLRWSAAGNQTWLHVIPSSGMLDAGKSLTLKICGDIAGVEAGRYSGQVILTSDDADNSPQTISVYLIVA